jgi:hypothetical protein
MRIFIAKNHSMKKLMNNQDQIKFLEGVLRTHEDIVKLHKKEIKKIKNKISTLKSENLKNFDYVLSFIDPIDIFKTGDEEDNYNTFVKMCKDKINVDDLILYYGNSIQKHGISVDIETFKYLIDYHLYHVSHEWGGDWCDGELNPINIENYYPKNIKNVEQLKEKFLKCIERNRSTKSTSGAENEMVKFVMIYCCVKWQETGRWKLTEKYNFSDFDY